MLTDIRAALHGSTIETDGSVDLQGRLPAPIWLEPSDYGGDSSGVSSNSTVERVDSPSGAPWRNPRRTEIPLPSAPPNTQSTAAEALSDRLPPKVKPSPPIVQGTASAAVNTLLTDTHLLAPQQGKGAASATAVMMATQNDDIVLCRHGYRCNCTWGCHEGTPWYKSMHRQTR